MTESTSKEIEFLYVAGKWADREKIGNIIKQLQQHGFIVTHNWTRVETKDLLKNLTEKTDTKEHDVDEDGHSGFTAEYMAACAKNDIEGVVEADALLVIMDQPDYPYRGTWTEIGAALALKKPVIIVMPNEDINQNASNVFFRHELVHHVSSSSMYNLVNYLRSM